MGRIHLKTLIATLSILIAVIFMASDSSAQIAASEFSTISQTIDGTVISMEYSRPSRRGRAPLFGGVMAYGEMITPGANMATTIEFSKDVTMDGHAIPAGKYSVWIGFEEGEWEFAMDETWQRFHGPHPTMDEAEYHFPVIPKEAAMEMETLTFHFPTVHRRGATLRMHWGTTMIEMDIVVPATTLLNVTAEDAADYVGTWQVELIENPPFVMKSGEVEIEVTYENDYLHTVMDIGPYSDAHDIAFFPKAEQVFFPVMLMNGEPAGKLEAAYFEFDMNSDGRAVKFLARREDDSVWLSGSRD